MGYCPSLVVAGLVCLAPASLADPHQRHPEALPGFQWKSALQQAGVFLSVQHTFRLVTEPGTREEIKGRFFPDYAAALKGVRGWGDQDPFLVNYVGHPFEGAVAGYIQVHNDPRFRRLEFGSSSLYWKSRLRAMAFAGVYSAQFEVGPLSEASIGNVGKSDGAAGVVDLVVTPLGGFGVMLAEDALDRFVVKRVERWTTRPVIRAIVRGLLNPNRSFANLMRFRSMWHRDTRPGVLAP